jgi:hypothetical protein
MRHVDGRAWLAVILVGGLWSSATACFLSTDLDACSNYPHPGCPGTGGQGGADAGEPSDDEAGNGCSAVILATDKPTYASGEDILISFRCAPGNDGTDWIGVYAYGSSGPTPPGLDAYAWDYVDGTQTSGASPPTGHVTITSMSLGSSGKWPLRQGDYTAYYLRDGGSTAVAQVDFQVQ